MCGVPQKAVSIIEVNDERETLYRERFLKEEPFWRKILDTNACIGVLVIVFLIGYFH